MKQRNDEAKRSTIRGSEIRSLIRTINETQKFSSVEDFSCGAGRVAINISGYQKGFLIFVNKYFWKTNDERTMRTAVALRILILRKQSF